MRKTDRKRDTKASAALQEIVNTTNQILVDCLGTNSPTLHVERSENIRWNRALFHLQLDGADIITDKTVEEIATFLNGALFLNKLIATDTTEQEPEQTEQPIQQAA